MALGASDVTPHHRQPPSFSLSSFSPHSLHPSLPPSDKKVLGLKETNSQLSRAHSRTRGYTINWSCMGARTHTLMRALSWFHFTLTHIKITLTFNVRPDMYGNQRRTNNFYSLIMSATVKHSPPLVSSMRTASFTAQNSPIAHTGFLTVTPHNKLCISQIFLFVFNIFHHWMFCCAEWVVKCLGLNMVYDKRRCYFQIFLNSTVYISWILNVFLQKCKWSINVKTKLPASHLHLCILLMVGRTDRCAVDTNHHRASVTLQPTKGKGRRFLELAGPIGKIEIGFSSIGWGGKKGPGRDDVIFS